MKKKTSKAKAEPSIEDLLRAAEEKFQPFNQELSLPEERPLPVFDLRTVAYSEVQAATAKHKEECLTDLQLAFSEAVEAEDKLTALKETAAELLRMAKENHSNVREKTEADLAAHYQLEGIAPKAAPSAQRSMYGSIIRRSSVVSAAERISKDAASLDARVNSRLERQRQHKAECEGALRASVYPSERAEDRPPVNPWQINTAPKWSQR